LIERSLSEDDRAPPMPRPTDLDDLETARGAMADVELLIGEVRAQASYDLCWRETRIAALRKEVHKLRDQLNAERLRSQVLKIKSDGDRR
jgi:hypothetical protein